MVGQHWSFRCFFLDSARSEVKKLSDLCLPGGQEMVGQHCLPGGQEMVGQHCLPGGQEMVGQHWSSFFSTRQFLPTGLMKGQTLEK
jgi:hypothetical protein